MKYQAAIAVLAFVAVQAVAVPEAAPSNIHAREAGPDPKKIRNWVNFCGVPGQGCGKRRQAPETEVGNEVGFCGAPGQPCAQVKRSANAIAEALADAEPEADARRIRNWHNFCGVPGQGCGKARDLIDSVVAQANEAYGTVYEREAAALPEAEAEPRRIRNWHNFCGVPGQGCGRRRDAAEATEKVKRDAEARRIRNWHNFCGVPGQGCGKPRNAEAIAEAINKADPSIFKATCFADGGECDKLLKLQKAFHKAKKDSADERKIKDPQTKAKHCGGKNECTDLTHAHLYASQHGPRSAAEEEEKCNAADGLCTLARRDLDSLEETIDSAVDKMLADYEDNE